MPRLATGGAAAPPRGGRGHHVHHHRSGSDLADGQLPCRERAASSLNPKRSSVMEKIQFFLPGPTYVPEDARQAMAAPVVGHRSAGFRSFYHSIAGRLPAVLRTAGDALIATGSSTLIMESAVISTAAASVLALTNGAFSERWHAISRGAGKATDRLSAPWGEAIDPDLVRGALRRKRYDAVTLVHNETSTGVMNPLAEIARAIREESDALVLVDAVSSLGGAPGET